MSVALVIACITANPSNAAPSAQANTGSPQLNRTVLPIHPPPARVITEMDARDASKPERFEIKAPKGAPNAVLTIRTSPVL